MLSMWFSCRFTITNCVHGASERELCNCVTNLWRRRSTSGEEPVSETHRSQNLRCAGFYLSKCRRKEIQINHYLAEVYVTNQCMIAVEFNCVVLEMQTIWNNRKCEREDAYFWSRLGLLRYQSAERTIFTKRTIKCNRLLIRFFIWSREGVNTDLA